MLTPALEGTILGILPSLLVPSTKDLLYQATHLHQLTPHQAKQTAAWGACLTQQSTCNTTKLPGLTSSCAEEMTCPPAAPQGVTQSWTHSPGVLSLPPWTLPATTQGRAHSQAKSQTHLPACTQCLAQTQEKGTRTPHRGLPGASFSDSQTEDTDEPQRTSPTLGYFCQDQERKDLHNTQK